MVEISLVFTSNTEACFHYVVDFQGQIDYKRQTAAVGAYNDSSLCLFGGRMLESHDQLYFECSSTSRIWKEVMDCFLVSDPKMCWEELVNWVLQNLKGAGFRALICNLAWHATMYHIWTQQNARVHVGLFKSEEFIVKTIKWEVRCGV